MIDDKNIQSAEMTKIKSNTYSEDVRRAVRISFRENGGNLAKAARAHGVSAATARRWKQQDHAKQRDWNQLLAQPAGDIKVLGRSVNWLAKNSRETLVGGLLEDYLLLHKDAVDAVKNQLDDPMQRVDALSRLSQALDRTLRALGKASPELSRLAVAKWVLERQAEFVTNRFPDHLPIFVEVLEPFGAELLQEVRK